MHAEHADHAIGGDIAVGVDQDVGVAAGLVEPTDLTCSGEQLVAGVADEGEGGVAIAGVSVGVDQIERDQVADRRVDKTIGSGAR